MVVLFNAGCKGPYDRQGRVANAVYPQERVSGVLHVQFKAWGDIYSNRDLVFWMDEGACWIYRALLDDVPGSKQYLL